MKKLLLNEKQILLLILYMQILAFNGCEEIFDSTTYPRTTSSHPFSYRKDNDSIEEWNRRHNNYIQKINDDFYVVPSTPHYIQIRQISDTIEELDVQ